MKQRAVRTFRAGPAEQSAIRALKNWLLMAPGENALEDQIVRQRISAAIAEISAAVRVADRTGR